MSQTIAFTIPILPGKTETDRREMRSCQEGERAAGFAESRREHGVTREAVWIQPGPDGDRVVVYLEAGDLQGAFAGMGTSDDPFDRWFRDHVREVHGVDLAAGFPPPESVLDYRA